MYFLIFQEIAAFNNHDNSNTTLYQSKQKAFLETHLGAWISDFTDRVVENTETDFYKSLARQTNSFVMEDLKYLCNSTLLTIQDALLA